MSREVIGDAPHGATTDVPERSRVTGVLHASRRALLASAPEVKPRSPQRRRPLAAGVAAALLAGAAVGFAAAEPPGDEARGVSATVTGASAASSDDATRRALLAIAVVNPGTQNIRVAGYVATARSSAVTGLDRPLAHVSPGEKVEITVDVALRCSAAAPLLVPPLQVEEEDGGRRGVAVVGAVAALTDLCAEGTDDGHPILAGGTRRDGDDLLVEIVAPSNRRTEIRAVRATGVALDAADLPVTVGRQPLLVRLRPPAECPAAWRQDGIPTGLDLEIDAAGPAVVRLPVGAPLAQWALDVVCGSP
jgi:hypothetical protein